MTADQSSSAKHLFIDPSLAMILLSNVVSIVLAVYQQWPLGQILWVYWGQSVIIGIINVYRILALKSFSTEGLKQNGKPVPETMGAKAGIAGFFAIHYGFFHLVYAVFLSQLLPLTSIPTEELNLLLLMIFGFLSAHGFSYRYNINKDFKNKAPNLGTIMFYPYLRIIPMHLTIIFGFAMVSSASIIFFMLLKTAADAGMHMIEHHLFRRKTIQ